MSMHWWYISVVHITSITCDEIVWIWIWILLFIIIDTLPTHLQTTTRDPLNTITEAPSTTTNQPPISIVPPNEPVANGGVASDITFDESGHEKTFLFAKNNTFIQMDGDLIQTFQLRWVVFNVNDGNVFETETYQNSLNIEEVQFSWNWTISLIFFIIEKRFVFTFHVVGSNFYSLWYEKQVQNFC